MISDAEFARRLRMVRAYLGLTLDEAAEELGLATSTISQRERADRNGQAIRPEPRGYMATVYCRLSGWPPDFFTAETMPPLPGFGLDEDGLSPAEVVALIDDPKDDGEEVNGRR